jgi:hypothetical protein
MSRVIRLETGECFSVVGPEAGEEESSPDRRSSIEPEGFFDLREGVTLINR